MLSTMADMYLAKTKTYLQPEGIGHSATDIVTEKKKGQTNQC
jgi:hypothetical protein